MDHGTPDTSDAALVVMSHAEIKSLARTMGVNGENPRDTRRDTLRRIHALRDRPVKAIGQVSRETKGDGVRATADPSAASATAHDPGETPLDSRDLFVHSLLWLAWGPMVGVGLCGCAWSGRGERSGATHRLVGRRRVFDPFRYVVLATKKSTAIGRAKIV